MARSPRTQGPDAIGGAGSSSNVAPDNQSSEYVAQLPYWQMTRDMMKGTVAMRKNAAKYLPRFESETFTDFQLRARHARYTNIFGDIVKSLADRPFAKEPIIKANATIEPMLENIDGQNNHAFVFMADWMRQAITTGIHWAFVDYASVQPYVVDASGVQRRKSVAEERQEGARPYALLVAPEDVVAIYSGMIAGKEYITHVRMRECFKVRDGEWKEKDVERIRVLNREPILDEAGNIVNYGPATFAIYEREKASNWVIKQSGPIYIGVIAMVPLIIGTRSNGWMVEPDMEDCAYLQLEYFEQENGLKNIKNLTAFPMLSADNVDPQTDAKGKPIKAPVGPRAVLYGGAPKQGITTGGSWRWLEPGAQSLTFLREDLKELAKELRELGRQPLVASSSNITRETAAFASSKGKAAIRRWSGQLKDAVENVLMFMAMWENIADEPEVVLNLDDLDEADGDTGMTTIEAMYDKQVVSKKTYRMEAQRRGILSDSFDADKEDAQIEKEVPDDPSLDDEKDALLNPNGDLSPDDETPDDPPPEDET